MSGAAFESGLRKMAFAKVKIVKETHRKLFVTCLQSFRIKVR